MKSLHGFAFILLVIGGLNLGLSSVGYNAIDSIFGEDTMIIKVLYLIIGVSAIYEAVSHRKICRKCF